jgi:outer membrane usher protein
MASLLGADAAPATTTVYAGLIQLVGRRDSATVALNKDLSGTVASTELEHPAPAGPGFGYRVIAQNGGTASGLNGDARYQSPYGDYELRRYGTGVSATTTMAASGGIAVLGRSLFFSRPILDSFALVDVGAPNVRTYLNSQDVGRTNRKGQLLVAGLSPYLDNQLSIAAEDTPLEYAVEATRRDVSPGYRGGSVVRFPVHRYRAYSGTVVVKTATTSVVPSYGVLRLAAPGSLSTIDSDLGERGEFYLERTAPGTYDAEVTAPNARCRFALRVPESNAPITKMGTVTCVSAESR